MPTTDRKLLEHMTVLELTESQAGATCTQTLAWMGANVIKVEPVSTGEPGRRQGKESQQGQVADDSDDSVFFFLHNTASIVGSATLCFSRWIQRRGRQLH